MKIHPAAAAIWSAFIAGIIIAEWIDPLMVHTKLWVGLVIYFAVFETIGAIRRHRGDMLSEGMWAFSSGKWGARVFTASFGLYFAQRLYMLGAPSSFVDLPMWLPRMTLIIGFAIYIVVHMWSEGRYA